MKPDISRRACYSLLAQSRPPDEIIVVNNDSTDATGDVAARIPGVRVIDEPRRGLVVARETGRRAATGDILVYVDADCRAPFQWLETIERRFLRRPSSDRAVRAVSLLRLAPRRARAHPRLRRHRWRRSRRCWSSTCSASAPSSTAATSPCAALRSTRIGGFDTTDRVSRRGHQPGRRLHAIGRVELVGDCLPLHVGPALRRDGHVGGRPLVRAQLRVGGAAPPARRTRPISM